MKKYKLLKDIPWHKAGEILIKVYLDWVNDWYWFKWSEWAYHESFIKKQTKWFEEVKEINMPKYKVWDYVATLNWLYFIKIYEISYLNNFALYNTEYSEEELRLPTQKELEIYFR